MNKSSGYDRQSKSLQMVPRGHPCVCLCMNVCPFVSLYLRLCINPVLDEVNDVDKKKWHPHTQPLHDEREWPIGTSSNIKLVGLAGRGMT